MSSSSGPDWALLWTLTAATGLGLAGVYVGLSVAKAATLEQVGSNLKRMTPPSCDLRRRNELYGFAGLMSLAIAVFPDVKINNATRILAVPLVTFTGSILLAAL